MVAEVSYLVGENLGPAAETDFFRMLCSDRFRIEPVTDADLKVPLAFFDEVPFTVDYARDAVIVESPASADERTRDGSAVPVRLERDGPAVDAFMQLDLPGARTVEVEIDMGSDSLILDERLAVAVGVDLHRDGVRRLEGRDETGHAYTRFFTRLAGSISATEAPSVAQTDPEVMFQRIIYDGLVGDAFLRGFTVTYDLPRERVVFGAADATV